MEVEGVGRGLMPNCEDRMAVSRQGVVKMVLVLCFAPTGEKDDAQEADDDRGENRELKALFSSESIGRRVAEFRQLQRRSSPRTS